MNNRMFSYVLLFFFVIGLSFPAMALCEAKDELRNELIYLKKLKEDGIITEKQYDTAVRDALQAWQAKSPAAETAPDKPVKVITPPEKDQVKEPAPVPQHAAPVAGVEQPAEAPQAQEQQAQAQMPAIDWGILNSYFHITNVHEGVMKKKSILGDLEISPALIFDVTAKESFNISTTIFNVKFFDKDNLEIISVIVDIKEKYNQYTWKPGSKGTGYIPIEGIDMANVAALKFYKGFSSN
nr:hypothetical protein [uncultured Desulfobulbus sp.]